MNFLAILIFLGFSGMVVAEPVEVATIRIVSQPAAALLDTVRPLLGRDGSVSAYQDKLIVRGTAAQIEQVQSLINELDRPPRRLLIEVRQDTFFPKDSCVLQNFRSNGLLLDGKLLLP